MRRDDVRAHESEVSLGDVTGKRLTWRERGDQRRKANAALARRKARKRAPKGAAEGRRADSSGLILKRAADVKPRRIARVWSGRFARGKVGIIASEPGLGKSQIAIFMAATISTGGAWPCGQGHAVQGDVIYISAEDDAADTIRPRLEAAKADLDKVRIIESVRDEESGQRPFSLVADLDLLDKALRKLRKPRLVIIDPLNACMTPIGGQAFNPNSVIDIRALLSRLEALARKHQVAIVCITHFTKATKGGSALVRVAGSFALAAAARSVFTVLHDTNDPKRRIFAPLKNNLSQDVEGLAFRVKSMKTPAGIRTSVLKWEKKPVPLTAMGAEAARCSATTTEAIKFLMQNVPKNGIAAKAILKLGADAGFTAKELRTAREKSGIRSKHKGGKGGKWVWLPARSGKE